MLTLVRMFVKMNSAPCEVYELERYRSGHNEAVLKTVCPQGRVGSNPTLSAGDTSPPSLFYGFTDCCKGYKTSHSISFKFRIKLEKYPSG